MPLLNIADKISHIYLPTVPTFLNKKRHSIYKFGLVEFDKQLKLAQNFFSDIKYNNKVNLQN